jgi:prophage endopeptidase
MSKYLLIAALLVSFSAGFGVQGWRMGEKLAKANLETSKTLQKIAVTAANKQRELQDELDKKQAVWAAIETEQYALLRDAEKQNNQLRADVDAGRKRLRVNASCPLSSDNLPETSTDASVGKGTRPELNPDARPTYNSLRLGIVRLEAKVAYLLERCE